MHHPNTLTEGGTVLSRSGRAPPDRAAAAHTARSTTSKGSPPAATNTASAEPAIAWRASHPFRQGDTVRSGAVRRSLRRAGPATPQTTLQYKWNYARGGRFSLQQAGQKVRTPRGDPIAAPGSTAHAGGGILLSVKILPSQCDSVTSLQPLSMRSPSALDFLHPWNKQSRTARLLHVWQSHTQADKRTNTAFRQGT